MLAAAVVIQSGALHAVPAAAHAILVASTPRPDAAVPAGPLAVSLQYNSLVDVKRSRLVLTRADGGQMVLPIAGAPPGNIVTAVAPVLPGPNLLRWQVLAIDGHITRGDIRFRVDPGARSGTGLAIGPGTGH